MADKFVEAFKAPTFKLLELKDEELISCIKEADEFYGKIAKLLPYKFTTNHGTKKLDEEDSGNEEEQEENNFSSSPINSIEKTQRAKTIEELHKRIENLRGKRANYKEKLLKKGLKNRLKKKRKLEERKILKKIEKPKSIKIKQETVDPPKVSPEANEQPLENDIKFNKLILSQSDDIKKQECDPKRILEKLEKKKLKIKKLESKGKKEKLTEIVTKEAWDTAIQKAEGVKVKDNIELLKKSVAKIKNRKNKSKKKWEEREKQVKLKKEETQKKRQENINKKKKERSKKRNKILIKKGRILPK